jgi:NADH:ubiquinone oxidoreductase subunit 4 (subunit M)
VTSSAERSIHPPENLSPITIAEKLGAGLLIFATLTVGLYPKLLLDRILPAVEALRVFKAGG